MHQKTPDKQPVALIKGNKKTYPGSPEAWRQHESQQAIRSRGNGTYEGLSV